MFEEFFHEINQPVLWIILLLVSLRAVYSCIKKKDIPHAAAFFVVLCASAYFTALSFNIITHSFLDNIF